MSAPDLLPDLGLREAWLVGLVVVLAALRPVGRLGWGVAGAIGVAGMASVAMVVAPSSWWPVVATAAWLTLAALMVAAAFAQPLRWEPRTGPGAATALLAGGAIVHAGAAWHDGGGLHTAAQLWAAGELAAADLNAVPAGPLAWPLAWVPGVINPRVGAALLGLLAAALVVAGAERLGRRWGYLGTARCTAAAVAWAPPLLLAHGAAPAALVAAAALVWSWWALVEVWGGRHRSGRLALLSGALLGVAVGVSLWPAVLAPLWLRRLGARTSAWFAVGLGIALVAAVGALVPTTVGVVEVWRVIVSQPLRSGLAPATLAAAVGLLAAATLALRQPLSPTRLSAVSAALLLATMPWWPRTAAAIGPVAAVAFVLLAAVAPDRPDERWPPDAAVPADRAAEVRV